MYHQNCTTSKAGHSNCTVKYSHNINVLIFHCVLPQLKGQETHYLRKKKKSIESPADIALPSKSKVISIYSNISGDMLVDLQIRNIHPLMSFKETIYRCFNPLTFTHIFYHACLCPSSLTFSPKCSTFLNWYNSNGEACKVLLTFNLFVKKIW